MTAPGEPSRNGASKGWHATASPFKMTAEQAQARKQEGNAAYKARKFEEAIEHFKGKCYVKTPRPGAEIAWSHTAAYELDKDVTYLNNLAAAQYENGQLDESIETAQKAVDDGRDLRADYKTIAKCVYSIRATLCCSRLTSSHRSFGRIGTAYLKKQDYANAVKFCRSSSRFCAVWYLEGMSIYSQQVAHRTPDAWCTRKAKRRKSNLTTPKPFSHLYRQRTSRSKPRNKPTLTQRCQTKHEKKAMCASKYASTFTSLSSQALR